MKKFQFKSLWSINVLIIALCISTTILAQPTISNTILPQNGSVLHYNQIRAKSGSPYMAGANVIWDFSNPEVTSGESNGYGDPTGDTTLKYFPNANFFLDPGNDGEFKQYFLKTDTSLEALGGLFNSGRYEHHPSLITYYFPMNYLDSKNYNFKGSTIFWSGYTITHHRSTTIDIDAYGTLILDKDTIENVLRAKYTNHSVDSSDGKEVGINQSTSYYWFHPNEPNYILNWQKSTRTTSTTGTTTDSIAFMLTGIKSGNPELPTSADLIIYPNPAFDNVVISGLKKNTNYQLYDQLGREISNGILSSNNNSIDVSHLRSGQYFIKLDNQTKAFIIE